MVALPDRSSPLPLWAQIADDLRRRLVGGEFEERFPTDEELTRDYDVSRHTVREAVRRLASDGLLVRQRGRGTSLTNPILEQPLHSLYSLASSMRSQGIDERSEVRAATHAPAPAEVARELGISVDSTVVFLERLRFAGAEPIAWDRSWLPAPLADALLSVDLTHGSVYDVLATHGAVRITGGWERIRPLVPSAQERELLGLSEGVAAFSIERLVLVGETPVEWRRSMIRGDRYSLLAQWPAGTTTTIAAEVTPRTTA
ncbi:MAG: GntR family transcriptional regulator [Acidimicrobiales bacterium]